MNWAKEDILNDQGEKVHAQTPVILSASRSTDIPAFYADWFVARWKAGYVKWKNPFNGTPLYVSFKKVRAVVFWTKNAKPMLRHLHFLDQHVKNYYFQFTLNDYEKEAYERKVPSLSSRIDTFKALSDTIGKDRVIWRFDPLFLTKEVDVKELLRRVEAIGEEVHTYTSKFVFSFADISIYTKVQRNLQKQNIEYIEFTPDTMLEFAKGLNRINQRWHLELATCAEAFDLSEYGVIPNKCIDDDLMTKLFRHDTELMTFLGVKFIEPTLFTTAEGVQKTKQRKDRGQREACGCIMSKDIGEYNTCPHECVYCYANTSHAIAIKNYRSHISHATAETITGS
jgi:DNA repair photolyase